MVSILLMNMHLYIYKYIEIITNTRFPHFPNVKMILWYRKRRCRRDDAFSYICKWRDLRGENHKVKMNRTTMFKYELIVLEPFNRTITKSMTCSHRYRLFTLLRYVQVKCFKAAPYKI